LGKSPYKTALVTGASSGIGESIVSHLSEAYIDVYALARREDKLDELRSSTNCKPIVLDLNDITSIFETLENLNVDILINNAGIGCGYDGLLSVSQEDIETTITTNVTAAISVVRQVAVGMVARNKGHIVNISSISGLYPLVSSVYGASKGAMHLFCQNLRLELKGTAVRSTEICPGRVSTPFFEAALKDAEKAKEILEEFTLLTPKDVAEAVMYVLSTPPHVNVSLLEICPIEQVPGGLITELVDFG